MKQKKIAGLAMAMSICGSVAMAQVAEKKGLTLGGYGEAVYSYNAYSNNPYRYMYPDRYSSAKGYGTVDLPHVVLMLGYDFGNGWSMNSEIEFEHGGTEVSIEVEGDEAIEIEHEVERGGEVYLEQFWIQKSFRPEANIRAGMIIVPVGQLNTRHEPDKFFTVYRPEGESTILPSTWHQIGISFWGRAGAIRYEAQLLPGLNSRFFNNSNWISGGAASPYEYTIATSFAGVLRLDAYLMDNKLRLGTSGYVGSTSNDAYPPSVTKDGKTTGTTPEGLAVVATADAEFRGKHIVARVNSDFGYLHNAAAIGASNKNSDNSTFSPYQHTLVGQSAWTVGSEVGVDVLSYMQGKQDSRLFLFGRYEYYDSYVPAKGLSDYGWAGKHRVAAGINYYAWKGIVIKAEFSERFFASKYGYNNEPSLNLGITYTGFFK